MNAPKPSRKLKVRILAACFGLFLALIAGEIFLRLHYASKQRELLGRQTYKMKVGFCQTWAKPHFDKVTWNGTAYHVKTNNMGFRMEDDLEFGPPPKGVTRIACLGGSTTFGVGLDNPQTMPYLLKTKLKPLLNGVEVINAGVPGHSSPHLLNTYHHRVLPLKPDMLIIYCGNNDLAQCAAPRYDPSYSYLRLNNYEEPPWIARNTAWGTFLWGHYDSWRTRSRTEEAIGPSGAERKRLVLDGFRRNLTSILLRAKYEGCSVVLATFTCSPERDIVYYKETNNILRQLSGEFGTALIDIEKLYPRDKSNFLDLMHFSPEGEKLRTNIIWSHLEPKLADLLPTDRFKKNHK